MTTDPLEALILGPLLPDGRQSLVPVSDDHFNRSQTTHAIVLTVERDPPWAIQWERCADGTTLKADQET
jgi:hypothetical protein